MHCMGLARDSRYSLYRCVTDEATNIFRLKQSSYQSLFYSAGASLSSVHHCMQRCRCITTKTAYLILVASGVSVYLSALSYLVYTHSSVVHQWRCILCSIAMFVIMIFCFLKQHQQHTLIYYISTHILARIYASTHATDKGKKITVTRKNNYYRLASWRPHDYMRIIIIIIHRNRFRECA